MASTWRVTPLPLTGPGFAARVAVTKRRGPRREASYSQTAFAGGFGMSQML